tara:strand:- start:2563 stop:3267 length:705 start_codon:yes stop_codon:yes gene_type:complete
MRTRSEIKRNNIRKANLMVESKERTNRGNMSSRFGLFNEQCGTPTGGGRDTEGVYMGAPVGTEPMMDMPMMGNDMGMGEVCPDCGRELCDCGASNDRQMGGGMMGGMEGMDDDDMVMDNQMMMMFMNEDKGMKPDFLDMDKDGNTEEPMKTAAKDKMDEKCGGGYGKDLEEGCGDASYDDDNYDGRDDMTENYKAVTAKPTRDSWGNKFNHILNESSKVNGAKSLMHRMKRVIR